MNTFFNGCIKYKIDMTKQQELFIKSHYPLFTNKQLAEQMQVSETKVFHWLRQLGIKRKRGWKSPQMELPQTEFFRFDKKLATI